MAVYQDKAKERIKKGMRRMESLVERGLAEGYNEADTRKIISGILADYLGWDTFENITAEQMISSRYADYVIRDNSEELFVVEAKQVGLKLKDTHLNQARQYAVDEGIDWIILTNGDEWRVYRTELQGKIPVTNLVFCFAISDKSMKTSEKVELFYLLSKEANRKKEIEDYYQIHTALSGESLLSLLLSDETLNKLRLQIKAKNGQKLTNHQIAEALVRNLVRPEKVDEGVEKTLSKLARAEKAAAK